MLHQGPFLNRNVRKWTLLLNLLLFSRCQACVEERKEWDPIDVHDILAEFGSCHAPAPDRYCPHHPANHLAPFQYQSLF